MTEAQPCLHRVVILVVVIQWVWTYIICSQGARLITGKDVLPPIQAVIDPLADYSPNGASHNISDKTWTIHEAR
jgi:hypothetical protein